MVGEGQADSPARWFAHFCRKWNLARQARRFAVESQNRNQTAVETGSDQPASGCFGGVGASGAGSSGVGGGRAGLAGGSGDDGGRVDCAGQDFDDFISGRLTPVDIENMPLCLLGPGGDFSTAWVAGLRNNNAGMAAGSGDRPLATGASVSPIPSGSPLPRTAGGQRSSSADVAGLASCFSASFFFELSLRFAGLLSFLGRLVYRGVDWLFSSGGHSASAARGGNSRLGGGCSAGALGCKAGVGAFRRGWEAVSVFASSVAGRVDGLLKRSLVQAVCAIRKYQDRWNAATIQVAPVVGWVESGRGPVQAVRDWAESAGVRAVGAGSCDGVGVNFGVGANVGVNVGAGADAGKGVFVKVPGFRENGFCYKQFNGQVNTHRGLSRREVELMEIPIVFNGPLSAGVFFDQLTEKTNECQTKQTADSAVNSAAVADNDPGSRASAQSWLFPDLAGAGRPLGDIQSDRVRAHRRSGRKRDSEAVAAQGALFGADVVFALS